MGTSMGGLGGGFTTGQLSGQALGGQLVTLPTGQQAIVRAQPQVLQLAPQPVQQQFMQMQVPVTGPNGQATLQTVQVPVQMAPQAPLAMVPQLVQTNAGQQIVYAQAQQQQPQMAMMMMPNGQLQQVALAPQQFQMQQLAPVASQQTVQLASMAALPAVANQTCTTVASSSFTTSTVASVPGTVMSLSQAPAPVVQTVATPTLTPRQQTAATATVKQEPNNQTATVVSAAQKSDYSEKGMQETRANIISLGNNTKSLDNPMPSSSGSINLEDVFRKCGIVEEDLVDTPDPQLQSLGVAQFESDDERAEVVYDGMVPVVDPKEMADREKPLDKSMPSSSHTNQQVECDVMRAEVTLIDTKEVVNRKKLLTVLRTRGSLEIEDDLSEDQLLSRIGQLAEDCQQITPPSDPQLQNHINILPLQPHRGRVQSEERVAERERQTSEQESS